MYNGGNYEKTMFGNVLEFIFYRGYFCTAVFSW